MLQQFLRENSAELIARCMAKGSQRARPGAATIRQQHGIPVFLEQLVAVLGPTPGEDALAGIARTATAHGAELFRNHFTIEQVVHDYGDLCQSITELAMERRMAIGVAEFQVLNRALDNAIAAAVTEYASGASIEVAESDHRAETERLGELAHELRNLIHTATLAMAAVKMGNVGLRGATGAVLDRSIIGLRALIDRSLSEVRDRLPLNARMEHFLVADLVRDAADTAELEARTAECAFSVADVDPMLALHADRELVKTALDNILHNAIKFSHAHGSVSLRARSEGDRILVEVADSCGGLPPGAAERMFAPFVQLGTDRTGLGLGLAIVKRSVEANAGVVTVRDVPTVGCVFTIGLPRAASGLPSPEPTSIQHGERQ